MRALTLRIACEQPQHLKPTASQSAERSSSRVQSSLKQTFCSRSHRAACRIIRHSVRVSCFQKLRDFHQFSAQALISNAEVEFEELTRLSLRDEFTPILRFGGLL